jgi:hypothetical protein
MQKGKIFFGALFFALSGLFPWAPPQAEGSHTEPSKMANATIADYQSGENMAGQSKAKKESPFACNMLALDAEGRRRHKIVMEQMRAVIKEVKELSDGYGFRLTPEQSTILLTSEFIARERLCCPFFTFELVAEREDGPLWLHLRGREGVKDFIRAELGLK